MPEGPHGRVQEVIAPNVAPEDVLFPDSVLERMDATCGPQRSLRAIRLANGGEGVGHTEEMMRRWKRRPIGEEKTYFRTARENSNEGPTHSF